MSTRAYSSAAVERVDVSAYVVPTESPESDGTFLWDKTTLVVVEAVGGGVAGLGYSYADIATAQLIKDCLAGVGKCRRMAGGTMCPSFMVLREEKHTTRGRARLLFEILQGDPLRGGWRDEDVKESLDLCLSCKGCKGDCPVNVDIATYKAEFLSHYYDQVGLAAGERVLLPLVRKAAKDTLIVTDGFSCREQIAQGTDRKALHLAQVILMAMREGPDGPVGDHPEWGYVEPEGSPGPIPRALLSGAATLLAGGILAWAFRNRLQARRRSPRL